MSACAKERVSECVCEKEKVSQRVSALVWVWVWVCERGSEAWRLRGFIENSTWKTITLLFALLGVGFVLW